MPQFDTANFVPQLFWLFVTFAILYFGVIKMTLPKLSRVVDAREKSIGDDLAAADGARTQSAEIDESYQAALGKAREEALSHVSEAKTAGAQATEARVAVANAEIAEKIAAAEEKIAAARSEAVAALDGTAVEAAADIVERLTGSRPSDADAQAAFGAAS